MDDALARIEKIVRDLLDFSRKKDLLLKPTDLNEVIRAAVELVHLQLKKRKLTINQELQQDLPPIPGDRQHLQQVFLNLLLNAVDATPEGGTISIKTMIEDGSVVAAVRDIAVESDVTGTIFRVWLPQGPAQASERHQRRQSANGRNCGGNDRLRDGRFCGHGHETGRLRLSDQTV